jgi:hypothetical protein
VQARISRRRAANPATAGSLAAAAAEPPLAQTAAEPVSEAAEPAGEEPGPPPFPARCPSLDADPALLAAATTSLPETPKGERNWDYRYSWVRDSTFTLWGLYTLGFDWEANDFFYFLADGPRMLAAVMRLVPLDERYQWQLLQEFEEVSRAVVSATLLAAIVHPAGVQDRGGAEPLLRHPAPLCGGEIVGTTNPPHPLSPCPPRPKAPPQGDLFGA